MAKADARLRARLAALAPAAAPAAHAGARLQCHALNFEALGGLLHRKVRAPPPQGSVFLTFHSGEDRRVKRALKEGFKVYAATAGWGGARKERRVEAAFLRCVFCSHCNAHLQRLHTRG